MGLSPVRGQEAPRSRRRDIAPTAVLIGDCGREEGECLVRCGAEGDFNRIVVGSGTSVQDNSVIHEPGPADQDRLNVTVGHLSLLEGVRSRTG